MKTAQDSSAQLIDVAQSGEVCDVTVRFGNRAVVLEGLPPADAGALREIVAAAMQAGAHNPDAIPTPMPDPASPPMNHAEGNGRLLYGLPCPQCGAYFESRLQACPVCCAGDGRVASQEMAGNSQMIVSEEMHFSDRLRDGMGAEIAEACVRFGARIERLEAALRISAEEGARTIYETLFASQARKQPWEKCPHEFRAAYVLRVEVLLQEVRRRAGLETDARAELTLEGTCGAQVPIRLAN